MYGPLGNDWRKYELALGSKPGNFQVEIIAYTGYVDAGNFSDVALDDISFSDCSPKITVYDKPLNCDFEIDFCSYYQDATSNFDWTRQKGATDTSGSGPSKDHTTGAGYYIYIETSYPQRPGQKARIFSSIQKNLVNYQVCFGFWYHMFGEDIDTLNVYLDTYSSTDVNSFNRTLIWKKKGTQGNRWYEAKKAIFSSVPWKIVFEGVVGKSYQGDIAIDDVEAFIGTCPLTKTCDFEIDNCDYSNVVDGTASNKWEFGMPSKSFVDHTTLTNNGNFAYVSFLNSIPIANGRLESKRYIANGIECLQFWYLLNGLNQGVLNIYEKKGDLNYGSPVWTKKSHDNDEWRFGQLKIGFLSSFYTGYSLVFEAVRGTIDNGLVGIDDIFIRIGDCLPPINCNFEEYTICSWSQYQYDDMDWLLNQGQTDSYDTGPHVDVTLGTDEGVYLYIESSYPALKGDKAILTSEYLDKTVSSCFSLFYFMHGADVGSFNIYTNDSSQGLILIANFTGEQGFLWKQVKLDITNPNEFRIALEGVVSRKYSFFF